MLPFTREAFVAVFADYNAAVWPVQVLAYGLGLVMLVALMRPSRAGDRAVGGGLALMWAWTGVAYHGLFFASINKAAIAFAAIFLLQAALFAHAAMVRGDLRFAPARGTAGILGWSLAAYAALLYPLIGIWTGHHISELPMFGITPCPVTLFTLGILLLAQPSVPRRLLAIPFAWALVGGSAAFLLDVPRDWPLLFSSGVVVFLLLRGRRRARFIPS